MNHWMNHLLSASVFTLAIAGAVMAQGYGPLLSAGPAAQREQLAKSFIPAKLHSQTLASDLIGTKVYVQNGDSFGRVDDLLLDDSGEVAGIVVDTSGIFGIGGKSIGVPFDLVDVEKDGTDAIVGVRINLTKAATDVAPAFRDRIAGAATNGMRRSDDDSAMRSTTE